MEILCGKHMLGYRWILTDHWELATEHHIATVSSEGTRWDEGGAGREVRERVAGVASHLWWWRRGRGRRATAGRRGVRRVGGGYNRQRIFSQFDSIRIVGDFLVVTKSRNMVISATNTEPDYIVARGPGNFGRINNHARPGG